MFPWTAKIYHIYCNSMDQLAVIRCWVFLGSSSVKPSWSRGDEASLFFYFILFVCLFLYLFPDNVSFRFQIFLRLCQIRQITLLLGCITLLGSLLFLNLCGPCFELCTNLWWTCGTLPLWNDCILNRGTLPYCFSLWISKCLRIIWLSHGVIVSRAT